MRTFLIADDSPDKIVMLRGILKSCGWDGDILIANTTEQAFETIESVKAIDAAFIDYYIPSRNGPAIIKHLRTTFPACHIALVSSADNEWNFQQAREAGADATVCSTMADSEERLRELVSEWRMGWIA
jgi:CheY-like chemotaxis protein